MLTSTCSEQQDVVHCKVKEVVLKNNNRHPIIVSFQNGELVPESTADLQCGIYNCNSTNKKVVAVATNEVTYKGTLEDDEKSMCRMLLAIRNKRTNKVRLVEVDQVELKPSFDNSVIPEIFEEDPYASLYKSFGSKKIIRRMEQRNMQKLKLDAMEEQISQALDASTSIINESKPIDTDSELVPCNRTATNISEVYKLEDFILDSELDSFNDLAITLTKDPSAVESYSNFFQKCLKNAPVTNKIHFTKILLYAECLIKFIQLSYKDLKKKSVVVCPESKSLNDRILETFCVQSDSGRNRPNHLRDKAICYVIVLELLANNYTVNIEYIAETIKVGLVKLKQLCKEVGTVPMAGNKNIQVLKFPLPLVIRKTFKKTSTRDRYR